MLGSGLWTGARGFMRSDEVLDCQRPTANQHLVSHGMRARGRLNPHSDATITAPGPGPVAAVPYREHAVRVATDRPCFISSEIPVGFGAAVPRNIPHRTDCVFGLFVSGAKILGLGGMWTREDGRRPLAGGRFVIFAVAV